MKVFAVIPARNEEPRIKRVLEEVRSFVDTIIVVDDGSGDRTAMTAQDAGAIVFRHAINRGQGASLKTGTIAALRLGADIIIHLDADGQHDPSFVPALIEPLRSGRADVVLGSRFLGLEPEAMPAVRRAVLIAARVFNRVALGIPHHVTDPQSGLRAMTADAARRIPFSQDRMAHASEILRMITRSRLRWMEIPVCIRYTLDTLAKGNKTSDAFKITWQLLIGAFQ